MTIKYCIHCEKEVALLQSQLIDNYHWRDNSVVCEGPFVECPPPEMAEEMWEAALETDYTVYEEESVWEPEI